MYRHRLEKYRGRSSRYTCPNCGRRHQFTRYIDTETGEHLDERVGICNRSANCGYHYPPREFFADHPEAKSPALLRLGVGRRSSSGPAVEHESDFDTIPKDLWVSSLTDTGPINGLSRFMLDRFPIELVRVASRRYLVGTWSGGRTVFWQRDPEGLIRTGKLMWYDPATGKRRKDRSPSWVHAELMSRGAAGSNGEYRLRQCCFGEHLLAEDPGKPIGVVESEKTAVIASMFLPDLVWLATGGCSNLQLDRIVRAARGRRIKLFPDGSQYKRWSTLARGYPSVGVSDLLEHRLTTEEKAQDLDLADLIIKLKGEGKNEACTTARPVR